MCAFIGSYMPNTIQNVVKNLKRRLRPDPYPKKRWRLVREIRLRHMEIFRVQSRTTIGWDCIYEFREGGD